MDHNPEAASLWKQYVKKVVDLLEGLGQPFLESDDVQLNQEQLSLKYAAQKAKILLSPISGQLPPLPLPTISFISTLLEIVAKYPRSIKTVCMLKLLDLTLILIFSIF